MYSWILYPPLIPIFRWYSATLLPLTVYCVCVSGGRGTRVHVQLTVVGLNVCAVLW